MTATATQTPVHLPDPESIRNRLTEIDREANFLRKLLRLVGKQRAEATTEKTATANTAR